MSELKETTNLLSELIRIPSYSREEGGTLRFLKGFFDQRGIPFQSVKNNLILFNRHFDPNKPNILLNSHHDTVKPNSGYKRDPFSPAQEDGKLYGLGSNDAGGALVCLIQTFCHYYEQQLPFNILLGISAEEEISGVNGAELMLRNLPPIEAGIVGEPTSGKIAVTEKGLLVLDCTVRGISGHAARGEGENAIYKALRDIQWFRDYQFPVISETLGPVHMNVTVVNAGAQHNVVPDTCTFTVDVRTTDAYTLEETLRIIGEHVKAEVVPRSVRLRPSSISSDHPLVKAAKAAGFETFGSPTLSDQAVMDFPTIKMGPGDSERSHTADEFIYIDQIQQGLSDYRKLLNAYINIQAHETLG